jgi:hypothetical protein
LAEKAGRLLDLYAREWEGKSLKEDEFVISADEKTSIQARRRKHATRACRPRTAMRVQHEYFRYGAWAYIASLDVPHARVSWALRDPQWDRSLGSPRGAGNDAATVS